jgi:hypothetical protein
MLYVHSSFSEAVDEGGSKRVTSNLSDEHHRAAEPGCGARLIRTLPSRKQHEVRAGDRFARPGEPLDRRDEIHVGATNHDNKIRFTQNKLKAFDESIQSSSIMTLNRQACQNKLLCRRHLSKST